MSQKTNEAEVDLKLQLELKKIELECEKVRAQIAAVPTSLWQRPAFAGSFSTVAVAIIGLIGGQLSGFFDMRQATIAANVVTIEAEKTLLQSEFDTLQSEFDTLKSQADEFLNDMTAVKDTLGKAVDKKKSNYEKTRLWLRGKSSGEGMVKATDVIEQLIPIQTDIKTLSSQLEKADQFIDKAKKQLKGENDP